MKTTINKSSDKFSTVRGYGTTGCIIKLSMSQMRELGNIAEAIRSKEMTTQEEKKILPFVMLFNEFSDSSENIWGDFIGIAPGTESNILPGTESNILH